MTFTDILALLAFTATPTGCLNSGTDCLYRRPPSACLLCGQCGFSHLPECPVRITKNIAPAGRPINRRALQKPILVPICPKNCGRFSNTPNRLIDPQRAKTENRRRTSRGHHDPARLQVTRPECLSQEKLNLNER